MTIATNMNCTPLNIAITFFATFALLIYGAAGQNCSADCTVCAPNGYKVVWQAMTFNTTITAATVIEIINTVDGSTRYSTEIVDLPAGYTVPTNTNADGTQTAQVTYIRPGQTLTTEIAFPTTFNWWPMSYTWNGTLRTSGAGGQLTCSTASQASVMVDYFSQGSVFETPTHSELGYDPKGLFFTTSDQDVHGVVTLYSSVYPNDGAMQSCTLCLPVAPMVLVPTARFVTETSVSYEGGTASSNPATIAASTPPSASTSESVPQTPVTTEGTAVSNNGASNGPTSTVGGGSEFTTTGSNGAMTVVSSDRPMTSNGVVTSNGAVTSEEQSPTSTTSGTVSLVTSFSTFTSNGIVVTATEVLETTVAPALSASQSGIGNSLRGRTGRMFWLSIVTLLWYI